MKTPCKNECPLDLSPTRWENAVKIKMDGKKPGI
jgi:hypothetical protein